MDGYKVTNIEHKKYKDKIERIAAFNSLATLLVSTMVNYKTKNINIYPNLFDDNINNIKALNVTINHDGSIVTE
ncbi:MAG: hypothetical protein GX951_00670 [Mollicutes bacterium]|nr:hypothetical protein [Mollicutes bacterium]